MNPVLTTSFCELSGARLPIVQTGMGWVSGVRLTAATSRAGGLGILASATMSLAQMRTAVRELVERTEGAPFGVNLRPDQIDVSERISIVAGAGVRLVSFAGGPGRDIITRCHDAGLSVMPTVGARRHAEKMLEFGVDALIAQGGEGGGHTGTVPTTLLLPQVVAVAGGRVPVLGAGGFHSGAGLVAALAYGASGIAMGTRFLMTKESRVPDEVKGRYVEASVFDTVVTKAIDGRPQRVIRTEAMERLERSPALLRLPLALSLALRFRKQTGTPLVDFVREGLAMRRSQELSWSQLALAANAPMMTKLALVDGNEGAGILPTGQVAGLIDELPSVADVVAEIIAEAETILKGLCAQ